MTNNEILNKYGVGKKTNQQKLDAFDSEIKSVGSMVDTPSKNRADIFVQNISAPAEMKSGVVDVSPAPVQQPVQQTPKVYNPIPAVPALAPTAIVPATTEAKPTSVLEVTPQMKRDAAKAVKDAAKVVEGASGMNTPEERQEAYDNYNKAVENYEKIVGRLPYRTLAEAIEYIDNAATEGVNRFIDFTDNAVTKGLGGIAQVGANITDMTIGNAIKGTGKVFGKDWSNNIISTSAQNVRDNMQRLQEETYRISNGNKLLIGASDLISSTIQAAPTAIAAYFTGGASLAPSATKLTSTAALAQNPSALNTISTYASGMMSNPNYWTSVIQESASNYGEALRWAKNEEEAAMYAVITGLINGGVEIGLDGASGIQGFEQSIRDGNKGGLRAFLDSIFVEGKEEVVQGQISRAIAAAMGSGDKMFSVTDDNAVFNPITSMKEFASGAAVAALLEGGQTIAADIINSQNPALRGGESVNQNTTAQFPAEVVNNVQTPQTEQTANADVKINLAELTDSELEAAWRDSKITIDEYADERMNREGVKDVVVFRDRAFTPVEETAEDTKAKSETAKAKDLGANTSEFDRVVRESQTGTNTLGENEAEVPAELINNEYDVETEKQSLAAANQMLEQDYDGTKQMLTEKSARGESWNNEEIDAAMQIRQDLYDEAVNSNEPNKWDKYIEWRNTIKAQGVEIARSLQAFSKYTRNTAAKLVDNAIDNISEFSEEDKARVDNNGVLDKVRELAEGAEKADSLNTPTNVDSLVDIIRQTAKIRKTAGLFTAKLGKTTNWALKHIVSLAKSGNADAFDFLATFAENGINNITADYNHKNVGDYIMAYRRNAMLSSVGTVFRNLVSNDAFSLSEAISNDISIPLDILISKFTKTRSVGKSNYISKARAAGDLYGFAKSFLEVALDVDADQTSSRYEGTEKRTFKMNGNTIERILSTWEKTLGFALNTTDEMKKGGIIAGVQEGINDLKSRGLITDDSLDEAGIAEALYATFQDNSAPSDALGKVRSALNRFNLNKYGLNIGLGDYLVPFVKVPGNLAARVYDYSVAGLANGVIDLANVLKAAKTGKMLDGSEFTAAKQAEAIKEIGRGINGTALITMATVAALKGIIKFAEVGNDDEDKDKAALYKNAGVKGTRLNLDALIRFASGGDTEPQDGDTLIDIAFLDPLNGIMTIGALIASDYIADGTFDAGGVVLDSFAGLAQAVLELPAIQTLKGAVDAYEYSKSSTFGGKVADAVAELTVGNLSGFIPNFLAGIERGADKYERDIYTSDNPLENAWNSIVSRTLWRGTLPAKTNSFGEPIETADANFWNSTILPGTVTEYEWGDIEQLLSDVEEAVGSPSGIYPYRDAPNSFDYDTDGDGEKDKIKLSGDDKLGVKKTQGEVFYDTVNMFLDAFKAEEDKDLVQDVLSDIKLYSRKEAEHDYLVDKGLIQTADGEEVFDYEKDATKLLDAIDFCDKHPKYNIVDYYKILAAKKSAKGKPDANGKTISGSVKADAIDKIRSLGLGLTDAEIAEITGYKLN